MKILPIGSAGAAPTTPVPSVEPLYRTPDVTRPDARKEPTPSPAPEKREDRWEKSPEADSVEAEYLLDRETNQTVIRMRDADTKEIVRELPSKALREVAKNLEKSIEAAASHRLDCQA